MKITHGSTFSGIGAPEVAAEMLGWQNAFHCEINPFGREVLDYYFPNAQSYEDITKTDFSQWRGKITVLTGGFPCKPFSYAGKRRGSEDDRYLWPFMLRCIDQIRPTWFVGENVAGITTMVFPGKDAKVGEDSTLFGTIDRMERRERYVIEEICQQLEDIGYSVQPMLIPACAVGAPHRRDRVFFIARNVADTDSRHDECRESREPTSTMREERLQERNAVQQPIEPTDVRPEVCSHVAGDVSGRNASNTDSIMLATRNNSGAEGRETSYRVKPHARESEPERVGSAWSEFPTVKPALRGRDDGLPFDVDNITIPLTKWREGSLKAYGNAIVVQVMYEIFRMIDSIERNASTIMQE